MKLFTKKHIESISSAAICSYICHLITVIYWLLLSHFTKWYIWIIVIPNRSIVKRSIFTLNWQTDNLTRTKKSINMNSLSALTALQISTTVKTYSCSLGQHVSALLLWMYYFLLPHSFESTAVVFFKIKCCVTTYTKDQNHMRCKLHIPGSLHIITTVIAKYKGAARQLKMSMKLTYIEQRTAIDQLYVQNV